MYDFSAEEYKKAAVIRDDAASGLQQNQCVELFRRDAVHLSEHTCGDAVKIGMFDETESGCHGVDQFGRLRFIRHPAQRKESEKGIYRAQCHYLFGGRDGTILIGETIEEKVVYQHMLEENLLVREQGFKMLPCGKIAFLRIVAGSEISQCKFTLFADTGTAAVKKSHHVLGDGKSKFKGKLLGRSVFGQIAVEDGLNRIGIVRIERGIHINHRHTQTCDPLGQGIFPILQQGNEEQTQLLIPVHGFESGNTACGGGHIHCHTACDEGNGLAAVQEKFQRCLTGVGTGAFGQLMGIDAMTDSAGIETADFRE